MLADAETILVTHELFSRLEVGGFVIHVNERRILNGLFERLGLLETSQPLLRALD